MKLRRAAAWQLAVVMALLSPGPQAWAQVAKTGTAHPGQTVPTGPMVVSPVSVPAGGAALSPIIGQNNASLPSLSGTPVLRPGLPGAAVTALPPPLPRAPSSAAVMPLPDSPPQAVSPAPRPAAPVEAAAPSAPQSPEDAPALGSKVRGLSSEAAPYLETAAAKDAGASSLRESGAQLQAVLEGTRRRPAVDPLPPAFQPLESEPSGLKPAEQPDRRPSDASPLPAPTLPKETRSKFRFYAGAVASVKVGVEALNLAVPLLLLTQLQAAVAVSTLYLAAEVASIFAGLVGGALVDRIGARRALVLTGFAQAAAIAGVPLAIVSGGALALPIVYALFVVNGVASELFDVARRSALPQIVGTNEGILRRSNGSLYVWREIAATAGVFGAGWLVHKIGAIATIWAHPAFCIAAAFAALRLLRIGKESRPSPETARAGPGAKRAGIAASAKEWMSQIAGGARYVFHEKKLRTVVLVNIPLNALHKIFHTLVAVVYAAQVLHNPAMAAVLLGAWNIGELAGAWYLERLGHKSRFSNWMLLGGAASLAVWAFWLIPSAWVAVPLSFFLAAAMIGNELGTASYMQATVPGKSLGAVTGFVYGFARAVGMGALLLSGFAFDALGPMGGFLALAAIFSVFAPIYFLASRRFKSDVLEPPTDIPMGD
ncbi:MAG: MFS transporter [Elusimicrobia bacterium]|nr:MFS transporter [Elusimicrobiota bacterium]